MELSKRLAESIRQEFPRFRVIEKQRDALSRLIDVVLRLMTLGGQSRYLTLYHTVIGYTLYVPGTWASASDVERAIVLRHERVHLRQRRRYGFFGMAFLYLVPFLPLGLAYGRARIEWEAYEETLRATAELCGIEVARSAALREAIVTRFTGPDYGWMWPFRRTIERWFDCAITKIEADRGGTG